MLGLHPKDRPGHIGSGQGLGIIHIQKLEIQPKLYVYIHAHIHVCVCVCAFVFTFQSFYIQTESNQTISHLVPRKSLPCDYSQ